MHGVGRGGVRPLPAALPPPFQPPALVPALPPLSLPHRSAGQPSPLQDPVPLDKFDAWVDCKTPGVKADLSGELERTPCMPHLSACVWASPCCRSGRFSCRGWGGAHPRCSVGNPRPLHTCPCMPPRLLLTPLQRPSASPPPPPALAAVKLTDEQKADAYYLRKMEEAVEASPAPTPVAAPAPAPAEAEEKPAQEAQTEQPEQPAEPAIPTAPAPVEVPKDGASTLSAAVAAAAALLGAALLAL